MARKKDGQSSPVPPEDGDTGAGEPQDAGQTADQSPEVAAAVEAIRRAKAELKKAREAYYQVRQQATDRLKQVREKTVGDLVKDTLKLVKKHPGPSVAVAALIGFFLGRLFRR